MTQSVAETSRQAQTPSLQTEAGKGGTEKQSGALHPGGFAFGGAIFDTSEDLLPPWQGVRPPNYPKLSK